MSSGDSSSRTRVSSALGRLQVGELLGQHGGALEAQLACPALGSSCARQIVETSHQIGCTVRVP